MFFMFLDVCICGLLIFFSFTFDSRAKGTRGQNSLINMTLFLALTFGLMALTVCFSLFGPHQLALLLYKLSMTFMAWFSMSCCFIMLSFTDEKRHTPLKVVNWILNIAAAYVMFLLPRAIINIELVDGARFTVLSGSVFTGALAEKYPLSWYFAYCLFYVVCVPFLATIALLVRSENTKSRLLKQNMRLAALGMLATWVLFGLMWLGRRYQPMLDTVLFLCFIPELLLFLVALNNAEVWGKKLILRSSLRFLATYILPAVLEGLAFLLLKTLFPDRGLYFHLFLFIATGIIIFGWVMTGRRFTKMDIMRDSRYAQVFEEEITSLNFEDEPSAIMAKVSNTFKKYVDTSSVRLAVDAGTGFLETIFTSDSEKLTIALDNPAFDVLLNHKHTIVFREFAEKDYSVATVRPELLSLLNDTGSEAFILLNEGRHVIGIIFLGKKESGNRFTEYDYMVFDRLFSNFFVVGYFMKNIMNESVVGTVNREIRMSAQIITSIQENMDYINNPKIDCGYRMIPAHNIGGEFVDLIRLNDTRHLFIIGALSGKGIAASMSMVILKSIIRTDLAETSDFKMLIQKINRFIRDNLPKGTFFAGTFGLLDFATDTMYYINCGSPALFMYTRVYNNVIEIQGEGHVLGFAEDVTKLVRVKKVKLAAGDIILACTDGLVESRSLRGESYGKTRVQSQIMENATFPADKMAQFTYDALVQFTSKALEDDVTVLVLKYNGEPSVGEAKADSGTDTTDAQKEEGAVPESSAENAVSQNEAASAPDEMPVPTPPIPDTAGFPADMPDISELEAIAKAALEEARAAEQKA